MRVSPDQYTSSVKMTVFNADKLEKHVHNSPSRALAIFDIVTRFISKGAQPIQEARQAIARKQPIQAAHTFHTLKGSVANLGGMRVWDLANELEHLLEFEPNNPSIAGFIDCAERELLQFLTAAERWLEEQKQRHIEHSPLTVQNITDSLFELTQLLQESNLKAIDCFMILQSHIREELQDEYYQNLYNAVMSLNFNDALLILNQLTINDQRGNADVVTR